MKKLLLPILAVSLMVPAAAQAADPCRNAKGQFAKCGTPGAMTYAQYKMMKGSKPVAVKPAPAAAPAPAATAKPSLFSFKPKATPTPAPSATAKTSLFSFKPKAKPTATPTAGPTPKPTAAATAKPSMMSKLKGMGKPKPTATPAKH